MRLCLGYYARGGFSGWTRKEQDIEPLSVEITDTGRWRMRHTNKLDVVCQSLFPKPIRFREVWKQVCDAGMQSTIYCAVCYGIGCQKWRYVLAHRVFWMLVLAQPLLQYSRCTSVCIPSCLRSSLYVIRGHGTARIRASDLTRPPLSTNAQHLPRGVLQASGDKALYIWRPVPPSSAFVAMGMVVTTTEEPPPQDSISCVPRRWVVESTFKPTKVTTNRALAKWGACIGVLVRFVSVVVPRGCGLLRAVNES